MKTGDATGMQPEQDEDAAWEDLDRCRQDIDAIDIRILSLLSERLDAAVAIGRIKEQRGMAVFDPVREKAILERMTTRNHGRLTPDAIRDIFTRIISAGRAVQGPRTVTRLSLKIGHQRLMNPKVAVIGGTGRMGACFSHILEPHCREIIRVGRSNPITSEQVAACDVLVFSVPMKETVKVIRKMAPLASEDAMIMDLTSIKAKPMAAMLHYSRAEVVGAHPLFGPEKRGESKKTCVLCEGRGEAGMVWIRKILESSGVNVLVATPEVHDHVMGMIQGANHFASLAFAICMARSGYSLDTLEGFATPAFQTRVDRVKNMMGQPGELFGSLLMENPSALGFVSDYLEGAREILAMVKQGDTKEFGKRFESLKNYFGQVDEKGQ